jgi:streptomycin 6-kinase
VQIVPPGFFVPAVLRRCIGEFEEGAQWLQRLPFFVRELERQWSLSVLPALDTEGNCAWIAPARLADGSEAILKVGIPHAEARREADALRVWNGCGAVRLLRVSEDGFVLLLERCVPGKDLWTLPEEQADAEAAAILKRLWSVPPPPDTFDLLPEVVAGWCERLPQKAERLGYDAETVGHAREVAGELVSSQRRLALLHGDLHPGNVLSAEREPWLAIDCKPVIGDPAFDLAQWLGNRYEDAVKTPNPVGTLKVQVDRFARLLELDPRRIAGWAFVKSLGWEWEVESVRVFRAVLRP